MPRIEVVGLRFNLEREKDRVLYEKLQQTADSGKRNECVKQILFETLIGGNPEARPAGRPRPEKKATKGAERPENRKSVETPSAGEAANPVAPIGSGKQPAPVPAEQPSLPKAAEPAEADSRDADAMSLVQSLVQ